MASSPSLSPSFPLLDSSRRAGSPAQVTRNPVALRIYKVLGATFDDEASKEALLTLTELYAAPTSIKGKEVQRSAHGAQAEHRAAMLSFLDDAPPGETAARARKSLRRDIETKLGESSQKFLKAFGEVDQKLDMLQSHISSMRSRCDEAQNQLQTTSQACKSLLDRAESLRAERQNTDYRQSIVTLFLSRFILADDEIESMVSGEVPVSRRFFAAIDKTLKIREDCRVLMSGEDHASQAGLDIMAVTASYLEKGYEKIFRWSMSEFRSLGRDATLEVSTTLREAVRRLRQRPELLGEGLMTLAQTRRGALLAAFLAALTNPTAAGARPIELHAHDPLRYVGDMLAWVHQAIAAEHEFLESLFGVADARRMVGSIRVGTGSEEDSWIAELMDAAVSGLCPPLKMRVLQAVRTQDSSITSYKVANLLQFYTLTMTRTIGSNALLSSTLHETTDAAYKVFFDAIEAQGRGLLRVALDLSDLSLDPPPALLSHIQTLRSVLALHGSDNAGGSDATMGEMQRILDIMIDPALQMILTASEEKGETERRRGRSWDRKVFVLNSLTYIVSVLESYSFTSEKRKGLAKLIDERAQELTEEHYRNLLQDTGLNDAVQTNESRQPSDPLSYLPATEPATLSRALHMFATWLSYLEAVHSTRLSRLSHPELHARIHRAALRRLANAYSDLCNAVRAPANRYEAAATLLGSERPFGSTAALWQILGIDEETDHGK